MKQPLENLQALAGFLNKTPLFSGLDQAALVELAHIFRAKRYSKGEVVFFESDNSQYVYIVHTGCVSIVLESFDGHEMIINEMYPGDHFGEISVIINDTYSTTAIARTDSTVLMMTGQELLTWLDREPCITRHLLEATARRLQKSSRREAALLFMDANARLAALLLELEAHEQDRGYVTISQDELAQHTGLTRQTVAKILGKWRRAGWLLTGRGHIMLLDHNALENASKESLG
jgi:CRP-like cAMP-binding protein